MSKIRRKFYNQGPVLSRVLHSKVADLETSRSVYEKNLDLIYSDTKHELDTAISYGKRIVLIYQMGKVGSTSYTNLLKSIPKYHVIHLHRMNSKLIDKRIEIEIKKCFPYKALLEERWKAIACYIKEHSPLIFIISGMRDPVARNISAYFENISPDKISKHKITELIDDFVRNYPHKIPISWFNDQFIETFDIDVRDYPFNKENGWGIIERGNIHCLLLNIETNEINKLSALNSFLNLDINKIPKENIGKRKFYSKKYLQFKNEIKFTETFLDQFYKSDIVRHFYSRHQIDAFYRNWNTDQPNA